MCLHTTRFTFMDQLSGRTRQFTIHLATGRCMQPPRSLLAWESRWASFGAAAGAGAVVGVAATSTLTATTISIAIPISEAATGSIHWGAATGETWAEAIAAT